MSELVAIVGPSGEGKSTSVRTLNPKETFIINVLGKNLPFKGWKGMYPTANPKDNTGNYVEEDHYLELIKILKYVSEKRNDIKNIILDDIHYSMSNEFMSRALEKGYEKFAEMGTHFWSIFNTARRLRPDLKVFCLFHDEETSSYRRKMKVLGKMLDDKVTMEGLFTIVLFTKVTTDPKTKENIYQFVTQTEDGTTAKSPDGMFDKYIPNDLAFVSKKIDEYYNGE